MAYVDAPKSTLFKTTGSTHPKTDPLNDVAPNQNRLWLLPEEALYLIERGTLDVEYVPTDDQVADVLTKALAREKHVRFTTALGLE